MIKINLLPEELRKEDLTKSINFSDYIIFPIALIALAVILNLLFGALLLYKATRLDAAKKKWEAFYPSYKPVEELKNKIKQIDEKNAFFETVRGPQISLAMKLNSLSDNLANGIWFRKLKISSGGSIDINGTVVSLREDEVSILNKFISSLRQNEDFSKDFRDIEIKSLRNRTMNDLEVKDFDLALYPK